MAVELTLITNSGSTLNGNALLNFGVTSDVSIQGEADMEILNDADSSSPLGGILHGAASIGVSAASLTAGSLLAMIDNRSGGAIDSDALINFAIGGNLTSPGDATFEILNNQRVGIGTGGGSIGRNATIGLSIAQDLIIGGDAIFQILNDDNDLGGGTIVGDATITVEAGTLSAASLTAQIVNTGGTIDGISTIASTVGGNLTVNGTDGLSFTIANNSGGQIDMAADVLISTGGDLTASSLLAFINNRDGGSIGGDGSVLLNVGGTLTTTGDATIVISGRDDGGGAGSIGGNASVILTADSVNVGGALVASISEAAGGHLESGLASVNVFGGDITTGGALTFSIQNGGLSQIGQVGGGTIDQNVQVSLNAANVTTGDFLLGLLSNTDGGQIGGSAALALDLTGNLNAQGDGTLQIDNSTTMGALSSNIGSDATLGVAASNFTAATVLAQIINEGGGTIGGDATIGFAIAHGLTSLGDVTFEILNDNNDFGGGTIAGDATITVGARTLTAASLLAQINNSGGSIGGDSSILFAISGALTTTGDADFHILGDSLTTPGATIALTVGSFNIGGSLNASIGTGQTFFNFDNVTIDATNGITVGDQLLVQGSVTAGGNISAVNGITLTGGSLTAGGNITSSAGAIIQNPSPGGQIGIISAGGNIFAAGALDAFYFDTSITAGGSITASDVGAVTLQAGGNITIGQATGSPHSVFADTILAGGAFNLTNVGSIQNITATATGGIGFTPDPFTLSARTISGVGPTIPALLFDGEAPDPTLGNDNPGNGGNVTLNLTNDGLTIGSTGDLASIDANGGDFATDSTAGGNGGNVVINASGNVSLSDGDISATTGLIPSGNPNGGMVATAGDGGTVDITAGGAVDVNSTIQVSSDDSEVSIRRSSKGGNINLTSNKADRRWRLTSATLGNSSRSSTPPRRDPAERSRFSPPARAARQTCKAPCRPIAARSISDTRARRGTVKVGGRRRNPTFPPIFARTW